MMRKSVVATLVAMMLVLVVVAAAFAQGAGPGAGVGTPGAGLCLNGGDLDGDGVCDNWVDADGDGVNDLAPRDGTGNQYGNRSSQRPGAALQQGAGGVNAGRAQGAQQGAAFVDQNGDGVCDAFVDANGDGVNDAAPRNGAGNQYGRRGR